MGNWRIIAAGVARFARAWIETRRSQPRRADRRVARFARAWIETMTKARGLKRGGVARFARAWIETPRRLLSIGRKPGVARFARAWIETSNALWRRFAPLTSPASGGRGSKPAEEPAH